ncbi:mycofactocin-coupled SDR family oxidoreductase [Nocardioides iriomotensis]|uniref:SDR family oxidoreductase n=1 Tax=Nocardioides iriomotensis TaxID=715784 RepID=A0A4Q5J6P9_9ACTN|nr:mycofactocin-coupled SDR family oxidoreductase [Nocardioides iriomotensis]RYU13459.1 SDR family oxidoreductase [Nocardioides iriomotensis]
MPVALVTGAARGIGAATVAALADDGYQVVALDACAGDDGTVGYPLASRQDLDAVVEPYGDRVLPWVADVRDAAAVHAAVDAAVARWGRLDAAVAAAAVIAGGRPLWETPARDLDLLWDVDLRGVWHTAAAAVPAMLAGPDPGRGRFVAVASAAGSRGLYALSAYTVVKHAVVGLVRGLAADLVGTGVTAVAVSPGATDTAMLAATAGLYGIDDPAALAGHQLLREPLTPAEVAATIRHCCGPEGRVLNGSVVAADGGFA